MKIQNNVKILGKKGVERVVRLIRQVCTKGVIFYSWDQENAHLLLGRWRRNVKPDLETLIKTSPILVVPQICNKINSNETIFSISLELSFSFREGIKNQD